METSTLEIVRIDCNGFGITVGVAVHFRAFQKLIEIKTIKLQLIGCSAINYQITEKNKS